MYPRILLFMLLPLFGFAQAPQKINFQSILRNTNGEVVANRAVRLKISILSGSINGSSVYGETHTKTTDASGLISLQIGNGTALSGVFGNIDWGNAPHFIKLEADFNGGNNFVLLGTQELMSVPYALYASKTDTNVLNLTNRLSSKLNVGDTISLSNRINQLGGNQAETDPVFNASISKGITATDTAYWNNKLASSDTISLSNRMNGKVNISDTSFMLSNYRNGLNNKVNVSDTSSMLANYRTELNNKAPINNPSFTGTVTGIDKNMVGLGNVDNTSDVNKPISTAAQTALNIKLNISDTSSMLTNYRNGLNSKVNISDTSTMLGNYRTGLNIKVNISDTSSMLGNYRTELNNKAPINNPSFTGTVTGIDKNMVGLGNVDNTSDVNKPISTAAQTALNIKVNISDTSSMLNPYLRKSDFPLGTTIGNMQYWNGTNWVNLAPGQNGQSLILINGIPSWSGVAYPTLTTSAVSSITSTSVSAGGNISSDGSAAVSARGLVYGTSSNPTLANTVLTIGSGTGSFSGTISGLTPNTTYYVRAYATNNTGTAYGNQQTFTTTALSPPVTDIDGNTYNTVTIGTQVWMSENLKTSRYRNGGSIPYVVGNSGWQALTTGAWSYYNHYEANNAIYGKLYNWYTTRGDTLCPLGWHVPSDTEWTTLTSYLGGQGVAGGKMKSIAYWNSPNTGATNESGFSALPGGYRYYNGEFNYQGSTGVWWSSSEYNYSYAWYLGLYYSDGDVGRYGNTKGSGLSVRCLRD